MQDVSVAETIVQWYTIYFQTTIFQCSKNFGSPTSVTRLKIAPNMADPTSMKHSVSSLEVGALGLHILFTMLPLGK